MKNLLFLATASLVIFAACSKDKSSDLIEPTNSQVHKMEVVTLEDEAPRFGSFACIGMDKNGNIFSGTKCSTSPGNTCTRWGSKSCQPI